MSNPNWKARRKQWRTLTEELEKLERTDPNVAAAAKKYDDMIARFTKGSHDRQTSRCEPQEHPAQTD